MDNKTHSVALDNLRSVLKPLAAFLDDDTVQEIMINRANDVWIEKAGAGLVKVDIPFSDLEIRSAITLLSRISGKDAIAGTKSGLVAARMPGFRVAAALDPTSINGASICIRKHIERQMSLTDYIAAGTITETEAQFFRKLVADRKTFLVAGGTSSGKTTFVNALIAEISPKDRVLTIEDTHELRVHAPCWVGFESNEDKGITARDLVKLTLRYRPDRVIVGEVRGAEAFDLLDVANSGHEGSMATVHANSGLDTLSRFETLVLRADTNWPHDAICTQIARTFDYVIHLKRDHETKRRGLNEVIRVIDYDRVTKRYVTETVFSR